MANLVQAPPGSVMHLRRSQRKGSSGGSLTALLVGGVWRLASYRLGRAHAAGGLTQPDRGSCLKRPYEPGESSGRPLRKMGPMVASSLYSAPLILTLSFTLMQPCQRTRGRRRCGFARSCLMPISDRELLRDPLVLRNQLFSHRHWRCRSHP